MNDKSDWIVAFKNEKKKPTKNLFVVRLLNYQGYVEIAYSAWWKCHHKYDTDQNGLILTNTKPNINHQTLMIELHIFNSLNTKTVSCFQKNEALHSI